MRVCSFHTVLSKFSILVCYTKDFLDINYYYYLGYWLFQLRGFVVPRHIFVVPYYSARPVC